MRRLTYATVAALAGAASVLLLILSDRVLRRVEGGDEVGGRPVLTGVLSIGSPLGDA